MAARRGFWARLFGAPAPSPAALGAPPPVAPAAPTQLQPPEEQWLDALALAVAAGRRFEDLTSPELDRQLAELDHAGRSRAALGWLAKFASVATIPPATRQHLRLRLVRRHADRLELDEAAPHLAALLDEPPPLPPADAAEVHALLAEHARARGDRPTALRHYEAVLAIDVDYPNVRARVARLRAEDGRREVALGETLASGELRGISAGSRYQLVRELGRGATGAVYLARDAELGRDVAVKLLHPHLAGATSAEALHQFFREARVMASLRHPNIVAVLDLDQRSRRIVMELAAGGTLRDVLRERGPAATGVVELGVAPRDAGAAQRHVAQHVAPQRDERHAAGDGGRAAGRPQRDSAAGEQGAVELVEQLLVAGAAAGRDARRERAACVVASADLKERLVVGVVQLDAALPLAVVVDARQRGLERVDEAARRVGRRGARMIAEQRVRLAGRGVLAAFDEQLRRGPHARAIALGADALGARGPSGRSHHRAGGAA